MRISDWSSDVCSSDLAGQVLTKLAQRAADCRRIEHGTRTGEVGIYLEIGRLPRTPGHEQIDCAVPARVASRGKGFADAGRAVTQANVAVLRSEEQTSELQSLMRPSYAVCCLEKK